MNFKDHGAWVVYIPEVKPAHLKNHPNILYAQRKSDGVDWYVYQRQTDLLTSNTVKVTLMDLDGDMTVMATHRDGSMMWPANQHLIEIELDGDHEHLRRKRFNLATGEFFDQVPDPVLRADLLIEMHHAGLLDKWESETGRDKDVERRISLGAERPMTESDRFVKAIASKLGWSDAQLKQLFDNARERIRTRHG